MLIKRGLNLNPVFIASTEIDDSRARNGSGASRLVICMHDGAEHHIEHTAQYLDGDDIYEIERRVSERLDQ